MTINPEHFFDAMLYAAIGQTDGLIVPRELATFHRYIVEGAEQTLTGKRAYNAADADEATKAERDEPPQSMPLYEVIDGFEFLVSAPNSTWIRATRSPFWREQHQWAYLNSVLTSSPPKSLETPEFLRAMLEAGHSEPPLLYDLIGSLPGIEGYDSYFFIQSGLIRPQNLPETASSDAENIGKNLGEIVRKIECID
ncbi:hypothetical protein HY497_02250 [Candidatus Woesearchaeota archaeon]|nr:hypothetical protein [Candidatus Woesearchaeota archaeon]